MKIMKTNARLLAELTQLLTPEKTVEKTNENNSLSIVLARLEKLEKQIADNSVLSNKSTILHPSQQKFQIVEANEILLPNTNEKACRFEPDKPCDYCSMCSAHGF